ncbi:MAG: hypothetical protein AAGA54_36430 [Myxococcota bacterium]
MMRMPTVLLGALTATALCIAGCDDKPDPAAADKAEVKADAKAEPAADAKAEAKAPEAAKNGPGEPAKPETAESADAAEPADAEPAGDAKVGVDVCDEYVAKYAKCIAEHAPEARKKAYEDGLAKTVERWQNQAKGPEKDSLQQACTAALDAVKKTSKNWGCTYD